MIDIRKLKELVRLMVENDLTELDLQDEQETVTIKRGPTGLPVYMPAPAPSGAMGMPASGGSHAPAPARAPEPAGDGSPAPDETAGLVAIESPMVGTFYSAANPDSPAFVEVGASVTPDTTVCLIEAMKVFNEIKAETGGVIERVLVENGQAVEFGQRLFLVRAS